MEMIFSGSDQLSHITAQQGISDTLEQMVIYFP